MDSDDELHGGKIVLSDIDCALKMNSEKLLNHKIRYVMWRGPEGQLGKGVGKPSEVFPFALLLSLVLK